MINFIYLLMPFCVLSLGTIHKGQQAGLMCLIIFLVGSMIRDRAIRYFAYYVGFWIIFIRMMNVTMKIPIRTAMEATSAILWVTIGLMIYVAVSRSEGKKETIFSVICISALVQAVFGYMQLFTGYDPFFDFLGLFMNNERHLSDITVVGTLGNPNFIGGYLAISLPFFFRKNWIYLSPVVIFHILTLHSTGAMAAACIAVAVYLGRRDIFLGMVLAGLSYVRFFDSGTITNPRWEYWGLTVKKIFSNPLGMAFGYGPGAHTGYTFPIHNEWLELWFYYGVVALFLAALYFFNVDKTDKILYAALWASALNCLGSYPMHLAPSALLILVIMGLLEREKFKTSISVLGPVAWHPV